MAAIKNIIFDLGGVLLNIDFNRTAQAFKNLGVTNFDNFYSKEAANDLFEALETGDISEEHFYLAMQLHCRPGTTFSEVQSAWNAILLSFRKDSIAALTSLKEKYSLYLLSNTNIIHHAEFSKMFEQEIGGSFDDYFIKSYYSHEMNLRKPYPATYQYVLKDSKMELDETLFIDDSVNNIEGAKQAGLKTLLLLPEQRIENLGL